MVLTMINSINIYLAYKTNTMLFSDQVMRVKASSLKENAWERTSLTMIHHILHVVKPWKLQKNGDKLLEYSEEEVDDLGVKTEMLA